MAHVLTEHSSPNGRTDDVRSATRHDVLVIGAGFSGLYLIHRLRDVLGLDVRAFERGPDVGGTWYWNRYPGARCDVESTFYSYSFDPRLQQDWVWNERYAAQPDILAYANHVADRFDLRRSIEFEAEVISAEFDDATTTWTITTADGRRASAPFLVTGVGCLSVPLEPDFEGMADFAGDVLHTGHWPHDGFDFTGKRVAVIGTGSSGIQVIPKIAEQAAELTVFQRTATYSAPASNRPITEVERQRTKRNYREISAAARDSHLGFLDDPAIGPGMTTDPYAARSELERRWWRNGLSIVRTFTDTLVSPETNALVADFVRAKIRSTVTDPETAALLEPRDYPIGTKRIVIDTDYFETYNRPNVHLVSVRDEPIERFTEHGIVVGGTTHEFDAIVLATGFDAITGALNRIRIVGREGATLREAWAEGPRTYLGIAVHGFPNLFTVTGPGSPSVLPNVLAAIEQHVEWISDYLEHLRAAGISRTEAELEAQDEWVAHVNALAAPTLFPSAASWYMGANVPGKPRVFMPFLGGLGVYRRHCAEVAEDGYRGFRHEHGGTIAQE